MKAVFSILATFAIFICQAQQKPLYDETLAKSLGGNENGMKKYVFVILKTGSNTTATAEERTKLFEGHMANIQKLATDKKLAVAGPFGKNDKNYRGIFIMNVETIEEAKSLAETDPAVKAKIFECEYIPWFGTAALLETVRIHDMIVKPK